MIMRLAGLTLLLTSIVNCAKVGFTKGESSSSSVVANPDGTVTGVITGQGTTDPSPSVSSGTTAAALLPKLQFLAGPCLHGALCAVEFRLDKAYAKPTQLDWHTNDTLYMTPHYPVYAQPAVHYVVTSGHVTFLPGETSKTVFVQNINPNNYEVIIGVLISNCVYDVSAESCAKFFPDL